MYTKDIRVQSKKHGIDETFAGVTFASSGTDYSEGQAKWDELAQTQAETNFKNEKRAHLVMEKVGKVPGLRDLMAKIKASGKSVEEVLEILEQLA